MTGEVYAMTTKLEDALNGNVNEAEDQNAPEMEADAVEAEATQETVDAGEQPEPEKPEETEPEASRDKKGRFAKKEKADDKPEDWSYHAYKDEKEKRQQYERELEAIRQREHQMQAQLAQYAQPQGLPDAYDDPQGFQAAIQQQIEQAQHQTRLQMSEMMARQAHGAETWEAANQWLHQNPSVVQQLTQSQDPCGDAVKEYKRHQAMQEIGDDPQAYRERVEAEIRERLEAEAAQASPQVPSQPVPANFASTRNAGQRKGPSWAGPTSLEAALGQRG
jgi:hypothetical protein